MGQGQEAGKVYRVKAEETTIRAEAGFLYKDLGVLTKGTEILVDAEKDNWLHFERGWVHASDLERILSTGESGTDERGPERYNVNTEGTRIREGPGKDFKIAGKLKKGEEVEIDEEFKGWFHVPGKGWIWGELLEKKAGMGPEPFPRVASRDVGLYIVNVDVANIRAEPDLDGSVLGKLAKGSEVEVDEERDLWKHVRGEGWVFGELLEPKERPETPATLELMGATRKWSYLSLTGIYVKVAGIPDDYPIVSEINEVLSDLTKSDRAFKCFLFSIEVPRNCPYRFNFRPERNRFLMIDSEDREFGNFIPKKADAGKVPPEVTNLWLARSLMPGELLSGIIIFSDELEVEEIKEVKFWVSGRFQSLY